MYCRRFVGQTLVFGRGFKVAAVRVRMKLTFPADSRRIAIADFDSGLRRLCPWLKDGLQELRIDVRPRRKSFRAPPDRRAVCRAVYFSAAGIRVVAAAGDAQRQVRVAGGDKPRAQCADPGASRQNPGSRRPHHCRQLSFVFRAAAARFFARSECGRGRHREGTAPEPRRSAAAHQALLLRCRSTSRFF